MAGFGDAPFGSSPFGVTTVVPTPDPPVTPTTPVEVVPAPAQAPVLPTNALPIVKPWYDLDGWGGNYTDDQGVDWVVTSEDGWGTNAPARSDVNDRPDGHGGIDAPTWEGPRVITLEGKALCPTKRSMNIAKDRLNAVAFAEDDPGALFPLMVTEEHLTRQVFVRRNGAQKIADRGSHVFEWSITLVAPDPAKYAVAEDVWAASMAPQAGPTGRSYPRSYPLNYGGEIISTPLVTCTNVGNRSTGATITFRGGLINPGMINQTTGGFLIFVMELDASDVLTVNLTERTAILNGQASRTATLQSGSAWFRLPPGATSLRMVGTPSTAVAPSMTVNAFSAWK